MAKDKEKKDQAKEQAQSTKGGNNMEYKRALRAKQSKQDKETARAEKGWSPSLRRKEAILPKHRCGRCHNPSAACRRGAKVCVRCTGSAGRSKRRQEARAKADREAAASMKVMKSAPARPVATVAAPQPAAESPVPQAAA